MTAPAICFIFIYSYESLKLQKIIQVTIFPSFFVNDQNVHESYLSHFHKHFSAVNDGHLHSVKMLADSINNIMSLAYNAYVILLGSGCYNTFVQ